MCKKLLILVILKPHKYQLLTLFLFCDFRLSAEEKFASSHHFCSFFECLVIFFVSFCLFKRSYKDLVKFSHHFTSGKKSPPPPLSKIFPQRLSVTCSYDDRPSNHKFTPHMWKWNSINWHIFVVVWNKGSKTTTPFGTTTCKSHLSFLFTFSLSQ